MDGELLMDIVLKEVSKSYDGKQVLSNFSCTIPGGSVCAVMAPSGTGKTTLLGVIAGLYRAYRGTVQIDGQKIQKSD